MFAEWLRARLGLSVAAGLPFPPASDRRAWAATPEGYRAEILREAEALAGGEYPPLAASDFMAYACAGDRQAYERPFFARRNRLIRAVLGECVQNDGRYLPIVIDGVWLICEESFWGVSAHNGEDGSHALPDVENPYIDLFAAQTGTLLALTRRLLRPELDDAEPRIVRRVDSELRRRILTPFAEHDDFWWMGNTAKPVNNWTPWIVSNVLTAMLALGEIELSRPLSMLDRYLASLPSDGACDEGAAYWNMAGGSLLDCMELLRFATKGAFDFYDDPFLRKIGEFPWKAHIAGAYFLNFSDCDARPVLDGERVYRYGERIKNAALMGLGSAILREHPSLFPRDTPEFSRVLNRLFNPTPEAEMPAPPPFDAMPGLGVFIYRKSGLYAAILGGNNGVSHNHNDVGNFVVYADGQPAIIDVGNMTYTGQTFSEARYTLFNTRSRNHNVPLIGGMEQAAGVEFAARDVCATSDGVSMDIAGAYPEGVRRLMRRLEMGEAITLSDEIELETPQPVTWVFMLASASPPVEILHNPSLARAIERIPVTDARLRSRGFPELFRLTLTAPPSSYHHQRFIIGRKTYAD